MATATFYSTAKRHNSTAIPTGGTPIDVVLKDGSDMLTPTFKMQHSGVPTWSMMQFEGRYYFITGVTSLRQDLWEISASVDVLATYKSIITGSSQMVLYANTTNTEIVDNRIPAKTSATYSKKYATIDPALMTGQWRVAVSCAGDDGTATYLLTPAQLRQLVNSSDVDQWFNNLWQQVSQEANAAEQEVNAASQHSSAITAEAQSVTSDLHGFGVIARSISDGLNYFMSAFMAYIKGSFSVLAKFFRKVIATPSAMDCIKAAVFIPWEVAGDGASRNIMLGEFDTGIQAAPVVNPIIHGQTAIAIPWQASDWRRNSPYHQFYLYLPFMGSVELSASEMIGCSNINVYYSLNIVNGAMNYRVATDQDTTLGVFSCGCGISYPIGASNITPGTLFTAVGGAAAAIAGSPSIGAAALAAASLSSVKPSLSCVGGGGGGAGAGLDLRAILQSVYHDTATAPSNPAQSVGVPVMARIALSGISGFVQTQNASVSGSMTDTERELINNMLNGGIYIE